MLLAERCESERLRQIIKELQRHRFGRRAETLPEDQMLLGLEDVEQAAAYSETAQDVSIPEGREVRALKRRGNRGALPKHLRGSRSSSTSTTRRVPAARASYIGSARIEASGWTWSPRSSGSLSPGVPNTQEFARSRGNDGVHLWLGLVSEVIGGQRDPERQIRTRATKLQRSGTLAWTLAPLQRLGPRKEFSRILRGRSQAAG